MLASARVTLKHHRFEVLATILAALGLAAACLWLNSQLLAVNARPDCFREWMDGPDSASRECATAVRAFSDILFSNMSWIDPGMAILPFVVGIFIGVPVVARELETRTAQTAWSLSPSRTRWLANQIWPLVLVAGTAICIASIASSMLHATRINAFPPQIFEGLGFHGPLVAARALAAFGLAMLIGAVVGRSLPAVVLAAVVCLFAVLFVPTYARDAWARTQPSQLFEWSDPTPRITFDDFYRTPSGGFISLGEALSLVPEESADNPYAWMLENGYISFSRGITAETASQWEPLEVAGTLVAGVLLVGATTPVVNRRRPTA